MVSQSIPPSASSPSNFFNGPIIEDLIEPLNDDDRDNIPAELVRFFRGYISAERMRERLDDYESLIIGGGNLLFSEEFSVVHLPRLFQHLLYRMSIVLNIRSGIRYSSLTSRERTELRSRLSDNRKNELNDILRAIQQYKSRYVNSSRELCFLLDMAIDVLNDVLYENE
jgi:hypothetical protein